MYIRLRLLCYNYVFMNKKDNCYPGFGGLLHFVTNKLTKHFFPLFVSEQTEGET